MEGEGEHGRGVEHAPQRRLVPLVCHVLAGRERDVRRHTAKPIAMGQVDVRENGDPTDLLGGHHVMDRRGWPRSVLQAIAGRLRVRRFRRNEVIFHQDDPGDSLHVVVTGAVKIVLPSSEGEEAIIATLRAGDFFGELALLDVRPEGAFARGHGAGGSQNRAARQAARAGATLCAMGLRGLGGCSG